MLDHIFALILGVIILMILFAIPLIAITLRRVVPTNMVHIVQTTKSSTPYGRGKEAGNTYYAFPTWVPKFGITVTEFPESIFQVSLESYVAYDQARLPFAVTAVAFFKIKEAETAAQRVASFQALRQDLHVVLQGAVRRVLATNTLEHIMQARADLSQKFTEEVEEQVAQWGVETVKAIEFMDIQDTGDSDVIDNMMTKEISRINKESRIAVAGNQQEAQLAEIAAQQKVDIQRQESEQQVGTRKAEKDKQVGLAQQAAKQEITAQARTTAEREMEVARVQEVQGASIRAEVAKVQAEQEKSVAIIRADQNRETATVNAEARKAAQVLEAEGNLQAAQREAEGVRATGEARAAAELAMQMASIQPQITMAKEIGENEGYQTYLIQIRQVDASQAVGIEMAKAMQEADLKVIANGGTMQEGIANLGDIFTPKGGTSMAGMITALSQTPIGKQLLGRVAGTDLVAE
jgi:flotillin